MDRLGTRQGHPWHRATGAPHLHSSSTSLCTAAYTHDPARAGVIGACSHTGPGSATSCNPRPRKLTDSASSDSPSSRSADAPPVTGFPPPTDALPGIMGIWARLDRRAVVQRSVHDLASLQYQRISAHARPPSGTSRPSGSAMPHKEHWAASNGRGRWRCVTVDDSADARQELIGSCSGPASGDIVVADETCGAMVPPAEALCHAAAALFIEPGQLARDVDR
jgi:hypothetical protein